MARLLAGERLEAWDLPYGIAEAAGQIVAELAANAVTHGRVPGRDFRLELAVRDEVLRVEVSDARAERRPPVRPQSGPPLSESGRGLVIVEALADRWGVADGPVPRKSVWAELRLSVPERGKSGSGGSGGLSKDHER
ncbi:ATP-binding protein [Streptomyces lichenis]|uniref:ATP-binding protein n=1 Tax=Streptomyces lichenis TaxID=2306967 RepID=A0ABT0I7K9_9ACTN|nr:ATP-binding protein [Streptomyces lichenis]